jgi:hypothetical protein
MWPFGKSEKNELLKKEYEKYACMIFKPEVIQDTTDFLIVKTVFEICHDVKGQLGCVLARNWQANWKAVQVINKDFIFSNKGVKWTRRDWDSFNPRRFALGLVLQTKRPSSLTPLSQQVNAIGHKILEMDTNYRPSLSFSEWKMIFKDWPFQ